MKWYINIVLKFENKTWKNNVKNTIIDYKLKQMNNKKLLPRDYYNIKVFYGVCLLVKICSGCYILVLIYD